MSYLRGLKLLLFLTCREAAPLLSRAMDQALAAQERAALRVHLWICPSCRRYRGQLALIRRVLTACREHVLRAVSNPLPRETRARIHAELARRAGSR
jgi:predicted anti-sigma-YlaC factor YlaD